MNLCIFGDSIVYGTSVGAGESWSGLLGAYFDTKYEWSKVYALGIGGDRTDLLLKRFQTEAEARKPDAILFSIGINDSRFHTKIPPEIFKENLVQIATLALNITPKVAFIGLTSIDESQTFKPPGEPYHQNAIIAIYDKIIEEFSAKNKLSYLSIAEVLQPGDFSDGLHPNAQGHKKLFDKILPFVESWLK